MTCAAGRPTSLRRDTRAVAMVEFAVVLPVLLLLYLGSWHLSAAISCHRKLTAATKLAANIVSQYSSVDVKELDGVLRFVNVAMAPYAATRTETRVSLIVVDAGNTGRVAWSVAQNRQPLLRGSPHPLPASLSIAGRSLVLVEATYRFAPGIAAAVVPSIDLADTLYMAPRTGITVTCRDCP